VAVPLREVLGLSTLNIQFSDDELAGVRAAAAEAEISMRSFSRQAVLDKARNRAGRVRAVAEEVAARSAELNRRLA
jgi:hypothetical protein